LEVAFYQALRMLAGEDKSAARDRLHPRRQVAGVPYRRVFDVLVASGDRANHHFTRVDPDPDLERHGLPGRAGCRHSGGYLPAAAAPHTSPAAPLAIDLKR